MSILNMERMVAGFPPDLLFPQVSLPFRFSPTEQLGLIGSLGWDTLIRISQKGSHIFPILEYVSHILRTETGEKDWSKLKIIGASSVLPNLAWHPGSHLGEVVTCAGGLFAGFNLGRIPLIAGEFGASALKNAASHEGRHVSKAVEHASKHGYSRMNSPRINHDCVRTILYASGHSGDISASEDVRRLLERAATDQNPVIANHAVEARSKIFG